jgi:hypothetical protein
MSNQQPLGNIYLVFWNLGVKDQPTVSDVRDRLSACNLVRERAADVPATTALRRAADSLRSKEIEAKTFTSKLTNRPRVQIDAISEDEGRLRRNFVGQYELDEQDFPVHVSGKELDVFLPAFESALTHYTGADISKAIQAILEEDGLGAFSPRKGGGVYFVPVKPDAADLLERIARFADSVQVRFLTYTVPDTAAQRAEIADAIANSYLAEIQAHGEAIAAYNLDTKPGIVSNRKESLELTDSAMSRLAGLMNGRYSELQAEIAKLSTKIGELQAALAASLQAAQEANPLQGRRRIVPNVSASS